LPTTYKYEKILVILFLLSLPLVNPWVRGDGVGYYAFARALLIEHRLDFEEDWLNANQSFRMGRIDADGHIRSAEYTSTGHVDNHFSIGPAILWSPFLLAAELIVKTDHAFGGCVLENGFSLPYVEAMAFGTAFYGFLGLLFSFRLAEKYFAAPWAFLATVGIWGASSLPVYMYFNPSWSHAHSAFTVALFFWYWDRTRPERTWAQWLVLGAISGLMLNVYYVSGVLLIVPLIESGMAYWYGIRTRQTHRVVRFFLGDLFFAAMVFVTFLPTLIEKKIIYGSYLNFGYGERWFLNSPAILKVAFSSEHGLFSWTPVALLALIGLVILERRDRILSLCAVSAFALYLYAIGCYENWAGISSFGSRFFVSLTPVFVLGLTALFDFLAGVICVRRAHIVSMAVVCLLILWNAGLIFQWGTQLIPARGPIAWPETIRNQFTVVPKLAGREMHLYFTGRKELMNIIEKRDLKQPQHSPEPSGHGAPPN
jgi:hypothetical protein